ncbi:MULTISPECIES: ribonucleoside-triphosphate reductase, adenosylcobalamin-dependent [Prochlorococcus]|uniref:Ribonucleotide reductase of class II (Coenzyme B12-dependent) n=1 Tax=Prochlorococcus marinus str. MIT 9116 TaxID=167544 RepID=A0A0A1ZSC0_PROMR|nr:ribonucleoside-triphosphate reductase, adenosylcobalamin-dependent [Prochlorococcus marinus]KGF89811.1 Ribonucleotide reductase of class II (coenzyme B12-dependent) [Prochlorococcus marinus str. MIT 9107]KGF92340.1 Ribonucleotide reductase of class II (coenzyme B12-dependent) [Prochlorococcus marinus str. MIT 9116]KGF92658.1 Ribonucleotide reductase of class II (coenzyme B12-dependent) [Prochlorococcus marinus str. MIT 9123]
MTVAPNKASSENNSNNLKKDDFPKTAPAAYPVFFRSYSRKTSSGKRENWSEVGERNLSGLKKLGKLSDEELILMREMQSNQKAQPSGRWLWIGGTPWINKNQNFSGAYNCTSTNLIDWEAFALMMDLAMMGCGTGAIIEPHFINKLPKVINKINIKSVSEVGITPKNQREEKSSLEIKGKDLHIKVGDSRRGWVDSYKYLLEASSNESLGREIDVYINLEDIRPAGESLKGFGGMANPIKLKDLYSRVASLLGKAIGRKLSTVECCLLIDEAAVTIVAGNIRRSAGMRQFASDDKEAASAKENLWSQDEHGNWRIDPEKDALRMANHTRVYHTKPSYQTVLDAVTKQFHSGEGAIQFAPEAIARSNADILKDDELRKEFIEIYSEQGKGEARNWINSSYGPFSEEELDHRMSRYGLNPCGEILGNDFHCNLAEVHLNQIDPENFEEQKKAFKAAALSVACLLNHEFEVERYRKSREYDPIVGVSFTGLFDFCVHAFGTPWLKWWEAGRPDNEEGKAFKKQEAKFLDSWRKIVKETVWEYCDKHNLRRPNRCTTVQPAGTKSLLTGAAPGWHPPKAQRFIRRITFRKNDPIALACMDYGYSVVPSQSDKDENGCLLDNPFDPRCTEWLVEIPTEVSWANIEGADQIDINNFSALAQFDFYMQVQKFYTEHNTSATVEFREDEIEDLAKAIHNAIENNEGYISAALLARFSANATFPRLPFEPISKEEYISLQNKVLERKVNNDFFDALNKYDIGELSEAGPAGCDSDKCLLPLAKPKN